jgi:type VI secretion system protein ImpG
MARLPHTDVHDLIASAEEFADAHPALAGALGERSTDAPLERVREGLFYLGAAAIDQIRHFESDGQRALADVVAPDLLRPFPAATIVELSSDRAVRRVPAGAEIRTKGPNPCRFRTVSETRVGPWRVEGARIDRPSRGVDALRFDLVATGELPLADCLGARVRLFVDGARESALLLVGHILGHTHRLELSIEGGGAPDGAALTVQAYGTRPEHALAPEPDGPYTGMSLLREYFLLPEKFCFVELGGLAAALRGSAARRATISLSFDEPLPVQAAVAPTSIRAHCVPAVNLFRSTAEPWVFEPGRPSAPVRVAGCARAVGGAYAVVGASAMARDEEDAAPSALQPVRRFGAGSMERGFPYAFSTRLVASPAGDEPDVVVCLTSPRGRVPNLAPHVVSLDLLATNRSRASAVRPGELSEAGPGMPPGVRARNILPSSAYLPAPTGPELALQVAVRAAVPDADPLFALQSRLFALLPRHDVEAATVRAHVARVTALNSLDVERIADPERASRGYEVRMAIDETPFQGLGDVALFVRLLHAAFEAQGSAGRFYRCHAICVKSGARLVWPPTEES